MDEYGTNLYNSPKNKQINHSTPLKNLQKKSKILSMNRHEKYLYVLVSCLFVLMLTFQNCDSQSNLPPTATNDFIDENKSIFLSSISEPIVRPIQASLTLDDTYTPRNYFPVGSSVDLTFSYFNNLSDIQEFDWNIKKIFPENPFFEQSASSDEPRYTHVFPEAGVYDISITPSYYNNTVIGGNVFMKGHKTLVVGLCGENQNILEITLNQGSLRPNTTATFDLSYFDEGETEVPNILWRVMHNNTELEVLDSSQTDLSINWGNISGEVLLEVFAQVEGDSCVFHRQKWLNIDQTITPYFNYVRPVDEDPQNVLLFDNNIYAYLRTSQSRSIGIDIKNAEKCLFNGQVIPDCNGIIEGINGIDEDITKCQESEFNVTAYRNDGQPLTITQSFYNYCPANDEYCAFGPQRYRPDEHRCFLEDNQ